MSPRRTGRVLAAILAPLLAFGVLTGPAYGQEPQPTPSATAEPTPSEAPTGQPSEQPSEAPDHSGPTEPAGEPSEQPSEQPAGEPTPAPVGEPTPEPEPEPAPASSARPPGPADGSGDDDDPVDAAWTATELGADVPSGSLGISPADLAAACASLGLGEGCTASIDARRVVDAALMLASRCQAASDSVCAVARDAADDAVALASACVNSLGTADGAARATAVDVDCRQTADNALVLAGYLWQVAGDCVSGYTPVCQDTYDLAALALDRAAGCLAGALGEGSGIRVVELYGTDLGCADAVAYLWRAGQGGVALLTGCLMGQEELCAEAARIAEFGVATLTDCTGEAVIRLTDLPNPLPAKDTPLHCWQAIDQVNHALNDILGRLPGVPTEISVTEDCVLTTRPRIIQGGDAQDTAQELLIPSCYPPEVPLPVNPVAVALQTADGNVVNTRSDTPTCNYSNDFRVTTVHHDWKKRLDHDSATNVDIEDKVKYTLELTKSDTFKALVSGTNEAEGRVIVASVKAQMKWEISYERAWDAKRSVVFEIPPRHTYHYAFGITSKISEGNWVERLEDCKTKTGSWHRVRAPYREGRYFWAEPYEGGPPK